MTTLWARLTWQAKDATALATDLVARLGVSSATAGGMVPGATVLNLGTAPLEVRPWVREGPEDSPTAIGRLMLEPVPGGEEVVPDPDVVSGAGDDFGHEPDPARLVLVGLGWATVDTDRAEADLDMWLGPPPDDVARDPVDPHLGAHLRVRGAAGLPGDWLVFVEPSTEGRAAASLARDGEAPCALYLAPLAGFDSWLTSARERGIAFRGAMPEPGLFGLQVLLAGSPPSGPHLIVAARRTPEPSGSLAGTIGA